MKRNKVLFIVHTEYHMLVAISLICDIFADESAYDIWVIQATDKNGNRFRFPKIFSSYKNIKYQELPFRESSVDYNPAFRLFYEDLQTVDISHCIIFNKLTFISFIAAQELSKKGTRIILAPDGAAAYTRITWFTPRWSVFIYLSTHRFLWANRIRRVYFFWPTLVYASLKPIDEVWVQYPEQVDNRAGKIIKRIGIMESPRSISVSNEFFGFDSPDFGACIFYTNQPFRSQAIYDFEINMLELLRNRFPYRKLVIKLHPSTDEFQISRFQAIENATCITSTIPAELLIAGLRDSLVVSFWSTALLVNNQTCRYYWLYPMLEKRGLMLKKISLVRPSEHIQLVDELEQIK
jgi:hypothetical protein